eukprot:TRINITY_DN75755_c0_g1_i1.p1 TRINITY_DN75755_c0_g1~~TRINITY_DN75755_c0_g1_i1.p1  ORF type:complete len:239 (+),score=26.30 TRINITY_DN75755_c0_g1_i1:63-719(+)
MSDDDEVDQPVPWKYRATLKRDMGWLFENAKKPGVKCRDSGLQYRQLRKAEGGKDAPKPGPDTPCLVDYFAMLTYGVEIESTFKSGKPQVLVPSKLQPGLREALQLMRQGERRHVFVPADLAYGAEGAGRIPGGCVIIYDLDLLEVGTEVDGDASVDGGSDWSQSMWGRIVLRLLQAILLLLTWACFSRLMFGTLRNWTGLFQRNSTSASLTSPPAEL